MKTDQHRSLVSRRLSEIFSSLGPREQDVAREILRDYPISALCTVAILADRSNASTATVLRLIQRLGHNGYGAFQDAVKSDVSTLLETPLQRLSAQDPPSKSDGGVLRAFLDGTARQLRDYHDPVVETDFAAAVALLADARLRVYCAGGHRSRHVVALLAEYLGLLRPWVQLIEGPSEGWARHLFEMNARSIIVIADIRRYQPSLLRFGTLAAERGAHVIALSDAWAEKRMFGAELLFRPPSAARPPFDSHFGQVIVAEALVSAVADALGPKLHERLALSESLGSNPSEPGGHYV